MQGSNSVKSACVPTLLLSLGQLRALTLTVTEKQNLGMTHVAYLHHVLTNPLKHSDPAGNTTTTYKSSRMSSSHAQLSSNRLSTGGLGVCSLGTWPSKSTDSEMLSIKSKNLSICCTTLTPMIKLTVASSSAATNATVYTELCAVRKPTCQETHV